MRWFWVACLMAGAAWGQTTSEVTFTGFRAEVPEGTVDGDCFKFSNFALVKIDCPAKAETPTVGGQYAGNHYAPKSEPQATHKLESEWAHMMTAGGDPSSCEHRDDCDIPATMEKRETDADSNWCNTCTKDSCTAMSCLPKKISVDVPACPKTTGKHYILETAEDSTAWCRPIKEAK